MSAVRSTEARVFLSPEREQDRFLPEGPRATAVGGRSAVTWVNIQTGVDSKYGTIFTRLWDNGEVRRRFSARVGFVLPLVGGDFGLTGCDKMLRRVHLLDGKVDEVIAPVPDTNPRTIINDAEIVPGGEAVVFGTKDLQFKEPIAALYLYTVADRRVTKLAGGQTCSNGKVFARDERGLILYDIDTPRRVMTRYRLDVAARTLTDEGIAVDLRSTPGFPDGMCDCGDGTVIIAFYNPDPVPAGRAGCYRLGSGELLEEWTTPGSPRVTCPLLVKRPDGVKLILTTATEGMPDAMRKTCPEAGSLFIADTSFTDIPIAEAVRV